jgi:hypothetical protein
MKKLKTLKNPTNAVLFAGATALMALTNVSQAQSSVDALLNKLEQKGVLTADESKELKAENQQDFTNSIDKAFSEKLGMPSWVQSYNIYGSLRARYEHFSGDNSMAITRDRARYRLFLGATVNLQDNIEVGFRIGSGDQNKAYPGQGNPLSQNTTLTGNWNDKGIYVDLAYVKWTPINDGDWKLATTFGKMERPFDFTWMVIDPDLTPEGGLVETRHNFNDRQSVSLAAGLFALQDVAASTQDPAIGGGQLLWNAKWTKKVSSTLGAGVLTVINPLELNNSTAPQINQGNTRYQTAIPGTDIAVGSLRYNYTPLIGDASVTYTLDSFPFYAGKFPITLKGEVMHNPGAPDNNNGYWAGIILGKSGKKNTWDLLYRYEYLESDAWYDQIENDDNVAFYSAAPGAGGNAGYVGGTNVKGHSIRFNYSITDWMTFSTTCYINDLINQTVNGIKESNGNDLHFMADIMFKF